MPVVFEIVQSGEAQIMTQNLKKRTIQNSDVTKEEIGRHYGLGLQYQVSYAVFVAVLAFI